MKIAILGTRGIPNYYGGFEQCAEFLALGLVSRGHQVIVYSSHNHPYKQDQWKGVKLVHCFDPEDKIGTAGQFIYDLNCVIDLRRRKVDIILQLGYTSSSVWGWLLPKNTAVTTNMDGLEWRRTKYSRRIQKFLLYAEGLAVKYSDHLISDSKGIQEYLKEKYERESCYIPYGADVFLNPDETVLIEYGLQRYNYDMLIARLEPENSIEIILDGVVKATNRRTFLVVGKHTTKYGEYLKKKYFEFPNIQFLGGVYNMKKLDSIRYFSNVYFHGHTVGGTNPSLLEAMASSSLVCANSNSFNRHILGDDGLYFDTDEDVAQIIIETKKSSEVFQTMLLKNLQKLEMLYSWEKIVQQYLDHFESVEGKVSRFRFKHWISKRIHRSAE